MNEISIISQKKKKKNEIKKMMPLPSYQILNVLD